MLSRGIGLRLLAGLSVIGLLGGCASSVTLSPPPATPVATVATPTVTVAPTPTTGASPTGSALATIGQAADDGARIVNVTTVDARTRDLTIQSPALGSPFGVVLVRLLLPSQYDAQPTTSWPALYLLCGGGGRDQTDWTVYTDVEQLTAPTDLLVVMPEAAVDTVDGWFSDWWNDGAGGPPKWETFNLTELRQLLERNWHAGDKRVIAGLSMGGYGAMEYAQRQPGMFLAAASFSGPLDPLGSLSLFEQIVPNALWGNSNAQVDVWKAHDPTDNAAALKDTALYVANGNGEIGPLDNGVASPFDPDGTTERDVATESARFVDQLGALHIPVTVDAYGNGTHNFPYFERDLHRWLPLALKGLGETP